VAGYAWARERSSPEAAFVGAAIFVAAPFHINEIYNAFNYAEFVAVAFLPFCFLFVDRLTRDGKLFNLVGLGVSYGLLILSNLPVAVMGTFALGVYALAALPRKKLIGAAAKLGAGFLFGLVLSAFYWIKVVSEMAWLNHSSEEYAAGSMYYDYHVNFLLQLKYLTVFDERNMWFANLVLICTLMLTVPLAIVYWRSTRSFAAERLNRSWIVLLLTLYMATCLSVPVWSSIGLLQKVQFPWRWLSVMSMAGIPIAAAGWKYCRAWFKDDKQRRYALIVAGTLLACAAFTFSQVIRAAFFHPRAEFEKIVAGLGDAPQNCDCWLPVWAKAEAMENREKVSAEGRGVNTLLWDRQAKSFTVAAGEPATVRLATFYYPHWRATVNKKPVDISPAGDGALTFAIPAEQSEVALKFVEPAMVRDMQYLSGLAWLSVLVLTAGFLFRRWSAKPEFSALHPLPVADATETL
jgi:hypothetical protein